MTPHARLLALQLTLEGLTLGEIGQRLGVSRQRVHQLLKAPPAIVQEVMARTKGRCEDCGIIARPYHIHARDTEKEIKWKGVLRLLCIPCARQAHQKKGRGR